VTPEVALPLLVLAVVGWYATVCRWWPYSRCWSCSGTGKSASPSGRHWRPCRRCGGSGTRVRLGGRLLTAGRRHTTR
jgi:hypothetical protein